MDHPMNTFFRISPSLLTHNMTTPRSQGSSTFSSPSFAEHQTGVKAYRESPASLNSAHQDNPLFEGFPVLPMGGRKPGPPQEAARACNGQTPSQPGDSPKLQEQLHHLLTVLQHALELHSAADDLPVDLAPQLADELEAVAKKIKEKERAMPVERQLRAKLQLALTGAEATIRKLRATPTRCSPAESWHSNEAAASSPTVVFQAGSRNLGGGVQSASTMGFGGVRDSICKQLLQSPSSSMSPLSWAGPTTATCTQLFVVDDERLASPKELLTEQLRGQPCQGPVASACDHILKIPTHIPLRPRAGGTSSSQFQPPLYSWMKAVLTGSCGQSPQAAVAGDSLVSAVHVALSNTRTPPMVYGSPLHRRIQRLLAEQWSPSPLRHSAAQTGGVKSCGGNVEGTPLCGNCVGYTPPLSGRTPKWCGELDTDSPAMSNHYTDTSSSCHTPASVRQHNNGTLPFRSSVSPFGPTLRERYGRANSAAQETGGGQSTTTMEAASVCKAENPAALASQQGEQAEAAELVAELGLDLQLDPETVGNISNLEVLEHVERWAREQFIAAKKALRATKGPALHGSQDCDSPASSECADFNTQALVDIAIQTEPVRTRAGEKVLPSCDSLLITHGAVAAAAPTAGKLDSKRQASTSSPAMQIASKEAAAGLESTLSNDADVGVWSSSHRDQTAPCPHQEAAATSGRPFENDVTGDPSELALRAQKRHAVSQFDDTPARRGLFRALRSSSSSIRDVGKGVVASLSLLGSDGGQDGRLLDTIGRPPSPTPTLKASLSRAGSSPGSGDTLDRAMYSPEAPLRFGTGSVTHASEGKSLHLHAGSNLPASGSSRGHGGEQEHATPQVDVRSGGPSCAAGGILAEESSSGPPIGARLAPLLSRRARYSEDSSPRDTERGELATDVLFMPGNGQASTKSAPGRRMVMPFRLANVVRFEGQETEVGDASAQTLSSISSVSIIASEPVYATNIEAERRSLARVEPTGGASGKKGVSKPSALTRHLRGFLMSLNPCSCSSKAS